MKGCDCDSIDPGNQMEAIPKLANSDEDAAIAERRKKQEKIECYRDEGVFSKVSAPKSAIEEQAKKWCKQVYGKGMLPGVKGKSMQQNFNGLDFGAYWLSIESLSECKRPLRNAEKQRVEQFKRTLYGCEKDQKASLGGSAAAGCSQYNITMDGQSNENSPPWDRKTKKPNSCSVEKSKIVGNWFHGMINKFCDDVESNGKEKGLKKQYTDKDAKHVSKRLTRLNRRTPPPRLQRYDGYKFDFEWTRGSNCQLACRQAFKSLEGDTCKCLD